LRLVIHPAPNRKTNTLERERQRPGKIEKNTHDDNTTNKTLIRTFIQAENRLVTAGFFSLLLPGLPLYSIQKEKKNPIPKYRGQGSEFNLFDLMRHRYDNTRRDGSE